MPLLLRLWVTWEYLSAIGWIWVFSDEPYFRIVDDSLRYCRANKGVQLNAYATMPTHPHLIVTPDHGVNLSDLMRDFKRHTSKEISTQLEQDQRRSWLAVFRRAARNAGRSPAELKVWQDEFHPIALGTDSPYRQKLEYLHNNPVRKSFVTQPEYWLHSSAVAYAGGRSPVPVDLTW